MPDTIASAARRVAEDIREGNRPLADDMLEILPVLDAVAAGRDDEGRAREETYCRALCTANGDEPDHLSLEHRIPLWKFYANEARAAMALADAERVEHRRLAEAALGAAINTALEACRYTSECYVTAMRDLDEEHVPDRVWDRHSDAEAAEKTAIFALDAAVRRLAGAAVNSPA